ncbi:MAG: ankyrin repeat domain-containing protein [Gemmatimonadaceae bacterium]|nr:ankyrin repeat domain-containing protein [Gemmatimonadaceae bacterium]
MTQRRRDTTPGRGASARVLAACGASVLLLGAWRSGEPIVAARDVTNTRSPSRPVVSARVAEAPVADAAMRGDSARVRDLLRQGSDVNAAQADGMTALHWAAQRGDATIARTLLYAGARHDAVTRNGNYTPLHLAARSGRAAAIQALLEAGANAKAVTTTGGATALHFAAGAGDSASVQALVKGGATVDARDAAYGQTPLMWAAAYDRVRAIRALVAAGADIEAESKVEDIAQREREERAVLQARARRVAALKAAAAPPAVPGAAPAAGATPASGAPAAAGAAPAAGARPADAARAEGRGGEENAATGRALSYGELVGGKGGLTPLLFAIRDGQVAAVEALLAAGAQINHVSAGDKTSPLLMATINGRYDLAKALLAATINIRWAAKSLYPQPTAQHQQQTTHLELMEQLIKAGADVNARLTKHLWYMSFNFDLLGVNTTGATPFWRAAYGLDVPAMKLLKQYGADHTIPTTKPPGRQRNADGELIPESETDPSGLPPIAPGGPGIYPLHAASGVGYGEGFAANSHQHAPGGWMPAVRYLIEELGVDVNQRDHNGYNAIHHASARGDNTLIEYLVSKGGDVKAISRRGQTTADMANGPVQRVPPFLETVELLVKLGSKNSNKCLSC